MVQNVPAHEVQQLLNSDGHSRVDTGGTITPFICMQTQSHDGGMQVPEGCTAAPWYDWPTTLDTRNCMTAC